MKSDVWVFVIFCFILIDTVWQENLEAMLLEDNEDTNDEISPEDIEEIENDASIYLDTSKGDLYD